MMKRWLIFFSLWTFLWGMIGQSLAGSSWEPALKEKAASWIASLAEKDPLFKSWADASYEVELLDSNPKQWLVRILPKKEAAGYLVIGHTPQGFSLLEYGLGGVSLFEPDLIQVYHPELTKLPHTVERIYQGLSSFFRVHTRGKTVYLDAKTGERIPDGFVTKEQAGPGLGKLPVIQPERLEVSFLKRLSVWDEGFPAQAILSQRKKMDSLNEIKEKEAFFEGTAWNGNMELLLEAKGYHLWSGDVIFVALEQEGYRFLPLNKKTDGGKFPSVSFEQLFIVESGA